jgi:NAD(P)-dependent dehydrogenase (short-subunit alcohol dehydrogenase family)
MQINGSVALVTGANRGLGRAFSRELVRRGAARVYGAARRPDQVTEPGVTPVALDITDQARVAEVAGQCPDVSLLINNAGVLKYSTFINAPTLEADRGIVLVPQQPRRPGPSAEDRAPRSVMAVTTCTIGRARCNNHT